ncbi:MAG: slipin family protein [Bacteroidales bacterium]|nr:slipin family protein [Bacteroidales bacterium]
MKRVRITTGTVGLVFKNEEYQRVLQAGKYWIGFGENVLRYNLAERFETPIELKVLLKDEILAGMLNVVDVKENQIAIHFKDGIFQGVLTSGKYAYWKWVNDNTFDIFDLEGEVPEGKIRKIINKPEIIKFVQTVVVETYQRGLMFEDGKFAGEVESGIYFYWKSLTPVLFYKIDTRQQVMEVSGQEILTKDKASLRVNLQALYKITDAQKAVIDNKDAEKQLYILIQLALREYIGKLNIDELLAEKEAISDKILGMVKGKLEPLGLKLFECGIRDIILPGEIRQILNQVLVAQKKAEANTITRREETASTRSMLNTAKLMEDNAMVWKIKEMEFVEKIADKISNISLLGTSGVVEQLKEIFSTAR